MISKKALFKDIINLKIGDRCDLEDLKQRLINLGYQRFELIDGRGQFSIRGGIVDISLNDTIGLRIELWGDEVDSIRNFNIVSQRSIENKETAKIYPAYEYILDEPLERVVNSIKSKIYPEVLVEKVEADVESILEGDYLNKIDRYFDSFYKESETILDYFADDTIIFIDEFSKILARSKNIEEDNENVIKALIEKERIIPEGLNNYLTTSEIEIKIKDNQCVFLNKLDTMKKSSIQYQFNAKELNYYKSGIELFINDIKKFTKDKKDVYIVVDTKEKVDKIKKILEQNEIYSIYQEKIDQTIVNKNVQTIVITTGKISGGFLAMI